MEEQSPSASAAGCRLLRLGAVALIVAAAVMLCASTAALYLWKVSDKNVSVNRGLYSSYCSALSIKGYEFKESFRMLIVGNESDGDLQILFFNKNLHIKGSETSIKWKCLCYD